CSLTDHIYVTLFSDGLFHNIDAARSDKDVNSLDRSDSNLHKCEDGYSHGKASSKGRHSKHKSKKRHGYIHAYAHVTTYVQIVCTMDCFSFDVVITFQP
ncbi:hypothetical protein Tco_1459751, partial [Tanacetum coccineum]